MRDRPQPLAVIDAEIVDEDPEPSTAVAVPRRSATRNIVARAVGDSIYLQMLRDVTGWGAAGTVLQLVETPYIDLMIANGFAVIVSSANPAPTPSSPTSVQWQPYTLYPAGWEVFAPNGQFVRRITAGVSGATYDPTQWTVVNDVGGGGVATIDGHGPDGSGNVSLSGVYVSKPSASDPVGSGPVKQADGSVAYVVATGGTPQPYVAVDTDGVTYSLDNGGLSVDTDGVPYYQPPVGVARIVVDTDGVPYPVSVSGASPS